jgi:hypothetical protein
MRVSLHLRTQDDAMGVRVAWQSDSRGPLRGQIVQLPRIFRRCAASSTLCYAQQDRRSRASFAGVWRRIC